jgi:hypothetical protein
MELLVVGIESMENVLTRPLVGIARMERHPLIGVG